MQILVKSYKKWTIKRERGIFYINIFQIHRDIAKYNTEDDLEESIEETGWKLVHGDIFRPPNHSRIFAAVIGSGIQLFCMMAITIFFAMLGKFLFSTIFLGNWLSYLL